MNVDDQIVFKAFEIANKSSGISLIQALSCAHILVLGKESENDKVSRNCKRN